MPVTTIVANTGAGYIDPAIPGDIDENEKAIVAKYGFHVLAAGTDFEVRDPVTKKTPRRGGSLQSLLVKAVEARKAHEGANGEAKPEPAKAKKAAPKAATKAPAKAVADPTLNVPLIGGMASEGQPNPTPAKAGKPAKTAPKADAPKELTGNITLDDTGKREKKSKKAKEPKVRKDNRYLRASRLICAHPAITEGDLASQAKMAGGSAAYCLEAWGGITQALMEAAPPAVREAMQKWLAPKKAEAAGK